MDKKSVYEIDTLWWNIAKDYSIFILFSLVGFMLYYAFRESYCDNALNLFQRCIAWLRQQRLNQASQDLTSSSNSLSNNDQQYQQAQVKANSNANAKKDKLITRANSEIVNKKQQTVFQQKLRQRQQSSGAELKKMDQKNKEPVRSQIAEISNMKQLSPKSNKIIKYQERQLVQRNQRQINQEQSRSSQNLSQKSRRNIYNSKESNNPQNSIKQQIAQQSRTYQETINQKQRQIKELKDQLTQLQKQNKYRRESLQNSQKSSSSSIDRQNNLRAKIEQLQRIQDQTQSQNSELRRQIKELLATQKQNLVKLEKLNNEVKSKQAEIITLTQRNKANEDYMYKLEVQNHNKIIELQRSRSQLKQHQRTSDQSLNELKALKQKYDRLQLSKQQQDKFINRKEQESEKMQRQIANLKQELAENYQQTQQLIDNLKQRQHELITLLKKKEDQLETKNKQMQVVHRTIETQKSENRKLFDKMQHQISDLKVQLQAANPLIHLFTGDIIEEKLQYKLFIKETIEGYTHKTVLKTKKLYTSEKDLNFSFHKYIEDIPDIVVIVQTLAGFYLAGYSQSPLSSKTVANKGGLIMALNNRKYFRVIQGKRSVTYDSYFLIIGNSEIRLKNQQWRVFSNFGIANSFFDNNGSGVNDLLGEGPTTRQVPIVDFEVHQLYFI